MALTQTTELTYLGLHLHGGVLSAVRVKTAQVISDGATEIMRQEGDETALADGAPIDALVGESLSAALATNATLTQQNASLQAQLDEAQGIISAAHDQIAKLTAPTS